MPTDQGGRLLALRVPDPAGGPPWGLRIVDTTRGMQCLQAGRVVGDQLGLLGQDGIAGRRRALPPAAAGDPERAGSRRASSPTANGRFFIAIDKLSYASGDADPRERACREPSDRDPDKPRCAKADARRIAFGLLGPEATKVTFADGSTQVPTDGDGAYLHVSADGTEQGESVIGGGPVPGLPRSAPSSASTTATGRTARQRGNARRVARPRATSSRNGCRDSKSLRRKLTVKTAAGRQGDVDQGPLPRASADRRRRARVPPPGPRAGQRRQALPRAW